MSLNPFGCNVIICCVFLFVLGSCSTYSDQEKELFDEQIQEYIDKENVEMEKLENGMYYTILSEGSGDRFIQLNDQVTFSYTGSFLNGEVFQVIPEENPLNFRVKELIIGWQDALSLIKENGEIKIILPPYLTYGDKNTELIPPNSVVVYELKVLSVR